MVLLFQLFISKAIFYVIFDQAEKRKKKKKKEIESGEIECVFGLSGRGWKRRESESFSLLKKKKKKGEAKGERNQILLPTSMGRSCEC